jgi:hypothetical protein
MGNSLYDAGKRYKFVTVSLLKGLINDRFSSENTVRPEVKPPPGSRSGFKIRWNF